MRTPLISIYKLFLNGSSDVMIGDGVCTLIALVALLYPESQISVADLKAPLNRPLQLSSKELEDIVTIEVMHGSIPLTVLHVWESKSKLTGNIQHILSERRRTEIEQSLRQDMGSIAVFPKRAMGATKLPISATSPITGNPSCAIDY